LDLVVVVVVVRVVVVQALRRFFRQRLSHAPEPKQVARQ